MQPQSERIQADDLEAAVDQAIAACDGDLRATIRALVVANSFLTSAERRAELGPGLRLSLDFAGVSALNEPPAEWKTRPD